MKKNGFTVLELLLTIALIAVLSLITAQPTMAVHTGMQLQSISDRLFTDLNMARYSAFCNDTSENFIIDQASYTTHEDKTVQLPTGFLITDLTPAPSGVSYLTITFDRLGGISAPVSFTLQHPGLSPFSFSLNKLGMVKR